MTMTSPVAPVLERVGDRLAALPQELRGLRHRALRRTRRAHAGFMLSLVIFVVALILPGFVFLNLDRGFELSDTGYYYVSIFHSDEIAMQTTQFAIVWQLLGLPDNIYLHRLTVFALMLGAGASLALTLTAFLQGVKRRGAIARPAFAAFGAGAFSLFYFFWLPDPSYNAIGLVLNGFLLALFFSIARRVRDDGEVVLAACVAAGALGMALIYVRPPTAALVALSGALLILSAGGWRPQHLLRIALATLAGGVVFLLLVSLLVEPIWETLARIEGGFERREILARPRSFEGAVSQYFGSILGSFSEHHMPLGAGGLLLWSLLLGGAVAYSRMGKYRRGAYLALMSGTVMLYLLPEFLSGIEDWSVSREGWMQLAAIQIKVLIVGVGVAVGFDVTNLLRRRSISFKSPARASLAALVFILAFAAQFVGTSNAWYHFSLVAFGLVMVLLLIPLALSRGWVTPAAAVVAVVMLGSSQFLVMHVASGSPYLLARPLAEQTVATEVGPGGSVLRLDPEGHQLITELQLAGAMIGAGEDEPAVLLDLTGTVPGATYLTGARAPGVPWLNWALPGSQQMFDNAVDDLSDDDFENAWVLYAPDWHRGLNAEALAARGRRVPDDYVEMGRAHLALRDIEILILAPREVSESSDTP